MAAVALWDRTRYLTRQLGVSVFAWPIMHTWHQLLSRTFIDKASNAALDRRYRALLERDLANVERELYPRTLLHQIPSREYLRLLPESFAELPKIFRRRSRAHYNDLPAREAERAHYPDYYLRNFHWQTDGWLSDRSAKLYDLTVELLFLGTADVMRRMAIPPIVEFARASKQPRVLDVACGTGRFLAQLHRALPHAKLFGLDLSPYYIRRAREVLADAVDVSLVVDNAEKMPFAEHTFDVVTSVFLFHELPKDVRRNVLREMWRVLEPGGLVVISDSAQLSESRELSVFLDNFPTLYHEPYFKSYVRDDLAEALAECGFESIGTEPHFVSKVVVARKPLSH